MLFVSNSSNKLLKPTTQLSLFESWFLFVCFPCGQARCIACDTSDGSFRGGGTTRVGCFASPHYVDPFLV
jgi:hypothetical protein